MVFILTYLASLIIHKNRENLFLNSLRKTLMRFSTCYYYNMVFYQKKGKKRAIYFLFFSIYSLAFSVIHSAIDFP